MMKIVIKLLLHLLAIGIIFAAWIPVARVFYLADKLPGWDTPSFLYHTIDVSRTLNKLPPGVWEPKWYLGMPRVVDNTWLNYYLIQPLVSIFGALTAIRLFLLIYFFLFLLFAYYLFYRLSKSILLSLCLTITISYSGAVHASLYSTGLVLSFLSQTWSVACFLFLFVFIQKEKLRDLLIAGIFFALALSSHPGPTVLMTLPGALLIMFSAKIARLKSIFIFLGVGGLLGAANIIPHLATRFIEGGQAWFSTSFTHHPETFTILWQATPKVLLVVLAITLVLSPLILGWQGQFKRALPFIATIVYFLLFETTLYFGINPLGGFSFPHRYFWIWPVCIGAIISAFWGVVDVNLSKNLKYWLKQGVLIISATFLVSVIFWSEKEIFYYDMSQQVPVKIRVNGSTLRDYYQKYSDIIESNIVNLDDNDYRLYTQVPMPALFWNIFNTTPQTRGMFRYTTKENIDWFVWGDWVVSQEHYLKGSIPVPVAKQQTLWLSDWQATRYYYTSLGDGQLADFFHDADFPIEVKTQEVKTDGPEYFRLPLSTISPLVNLTSAPTLGFIGNKSDYDLFIRDLATLNLNSRQLIPSYLGNSINKMDEKTLKNFDALFFYGNFDRNDKDYQNRLIDLRNYIEKGGIVYTEAAGYKSEETILPDLFTANINKAGLTSSWKVSGLAADKINSSNLSPLQYENGLWEVYYLEDEEIGQNTTVLLRLLEKPVLVERSIGRGKVIFSGLNTVYRPHYYSQNALNEAELLKLFLNYGIEFKDNLSQTSTQRPNAEKLIVKGIGRGVLFKENAYRGWTASIKDNNKIYNLSIIPVGIYLMYVRIPDELVGKNIEVSFEYKGTWENWLGFWISIISIPIVIFLIIRYRSKTIAEFKVPFTNKIDNIMSWWEKDEEI